MPRPEKVDTVNYLAEKFQASKFTMLTEYQGLNVKDITELRRRLRESDIEFKVFKNTLARLAASDAKVEALQGYMEGPTAYAFSDDPVVPAKLFKDFKREHPSLHVKGAVLDGQVIDGEQVERLANLPSHEALLGQLVTQFQSPVRVLFNVLEGPMRNLVGVFQTLEGTKEED